MCRAQTYVSIVHAPFTDLCYTKRAMIQYACNSMDIARHSISIHQRWAQAPTGTTVEFGVSRMWGKGFSGVGCNQFFSSYSAYGGDSIIWNVYAYRVCVLVLRSDLCSTLPWMRTKSPEHYNRSSKRYLAQRLNVPGMHASSTYFPSGCCGASSGGMSCSKPVPPSGRRTKRFVILVVR